MPVKPKGFRKAASKVLKAVGGSVTIRKVTGSAYNTTTGAVGETTADTTIKGFVEGVSSREVGDLVQANDKRLTIAASDLDYTPSVSDRVVISSKVHQIIQVETTEQGNTAISYELILRL
jgi:DNA replication initiation complex subunit (GINS family)